VNPDFFVRKRTRRSRGKANDTLPGVEIKGLTMI